MRPQRVTAETLLRAYQWGLFPMADTRHDPTIYWVDPELRGILPLDRFHLPRRLRRTLRKGAFEIRIDTAFGAVIEGCAEPAPGRPATWINDRIIELYLELFAKGHAHSVECWEEGRLAGGLYGVSLGAAFFGESMFSRAPEASKVALAHLVERLRHGGYRLLDTQFVTAHLARFGAIEVPRGAYLRLLADALCHQGEFYSLDRASAGDSDAAAGVRQSSTMTS